MILKNLDPVETGRAEVCKTFIRRFDPAPRLQTPSITYGNPTPVVRRSLTLVFSRMRMHGETRVDGWEKRRERYSPAPTLCGCDASFRKRKGAGRH